MATNLFHRPQLLIRHDQMIMVTGAPFLLQTFQMRWAESPVTSGLSWNDVQVKMRYFLSTANAIVPVHENAVRRV